MSLCHGTGKHDMLVRVDKGLTANMMWLSEAVPDIKCACGFSGHGKSLHYLICRRVAELQSVVDFCRGTLCQCRMSSDVELQVFYHVGCINVGLESASHPCLEHLRP